MGPCEILRLKATHYREVIAVADVKRGARRLARSAVSGGAGAEGPAAGLAR